MSVNEVIQNVVTKKIIIYEEDDRSVGSYLCCPKCEGQ